MYKGRCVNRVTVFEFLVYPVNNVRPPLLYVISLCRYNKYNFINIWTPFWSERGLGVVSLSSHRNNKPDEALWPKRAFIIDIRPCKGDFCCRELLLLCGLYLFKQLAVGSCDLSSNCCQNWANSQNDNYFHSKAGQKLSFWVKIFVIFRISSAYNNSIFSQLEINLVI